MRLEDHRPHGRHPAEALVELIAVHPVPSARTHGFQGHATRNMRSRSHPQYKESSDHGKPDDVRFRESTLNPFQGQRPSKTSSPSPDQADPRGAGLVVSSRSGWKIERCFRRSRSRTPMTAVQDRCARRSSPRITCRDSTRSISPSPGPGRTRSAALGAAVDRRPRDHRRRDPARIRGQADHRAGRKPVWK